MTRIGRVYCFILDVAPQNAEATSGYGVADSQLRGGTAAPRVILNFEAPMAPTGCPTGSTAAAVAFPPPNPDGTASFYVSFN